MIVQTPLSDLRVPNPRRLWYQEFPDVQTGHLHLSNFSDQRGRKCLKTCQPDILYHTVGVTSSFFSLSPRYSILSLGTQPVSSDHRSAVGGAELLCASSIPASICSPSKRMTMGTPHDGKTRGAESFHPASRVQRSHEGDASFTLGPCNGPPQSGVRAENLVDERLGSGSYLSGGSVAGAGLNGRSESHRYAIQGITLPGPSSHTELMCSQNMIA